MDILRLENVPKESEILHRSKIETGADVIANWLIS